MTWGRSMMSVCPVIPGAVTRARNADVSEDEITKATKESLPQDAMLRERKLTNPGTFMVKTVSNNSYNIEDLKLTLDNGTKVEIKQAIEDGVIGKLVDAGRERFTMIDFLSGKPRVLALTLEVFLGYTKSELAKKWKDPIKAIKNEINQLDVIDKAVVTAHSGSE